MANVVDVGFPECFSTLGRELKLESNRGSVIVAAAFIDEQLTYLIQSFLVEPPNGKDELLKVGGPIGDFGTKIQLAYRLGLISDRVCKSLNLYRRLRNDFAHLSTALTFDTPSVQSRITELFRLNQPVLAAICDVIKDDVTLADVKEGKEVEGLLSKLGTRAVFELCAASTGTGLMMAIKDAQPLKLRNLTC